MLALATSQQGFPSRFSFSVPDLEDCSKNPILTKVSFKKSLFLLTSHRFAFTQGGFVAVFEQALPKHSLVLYLITVL